MTLVSPPSTPLPSCLHPLPYTFLHIHTTHPSHLYPPLHLHPHASPSSIPTVTSHPLPPLLHTPPPLYSTPSHFVPLITLSLYTPSGPIETSTATLRRLQSQRHTTKSHAMVRYATNRSHDIVRYTTTRSHDIQQK